jgi:hypothetical protein
MLTVGVSDVGSTGSSDGSERLPSRGVDAAFVSVSISLAIRSPTAFLRRE